MTLSLRVVSLQGQCRGRLVWFWLSAAGEWCGGFATRDLQIGDDGVRRLLRPVVW